MGFTDRIMVIVDAASSGAVKELEGLQKEAKKTDSSFDTLGKKFGVTGQTLKAGLVAGAAALVGTGLVSYLQNSVDAFGDSAKAAGELAAATGGSAEEISRMQAALTDAGISADQSAGLITKFTVQVGKSGADLAKLNVELVKNKDGSTNYAATMVDVMDKIAATGDAAERSRLMVQFFGRQGAQSFQELLNSGMSLSEAMETISKQRIFDADDVARAAAYDDAMDSLGASLQGVQFTLGRALIPAITGTADALSSALDLVMDIPGPMRDLAVAAGLAAVGVAGLSRATALLKSEAAGALLVGMVDAVAPLAGKFIDAEGAMGKAGVAAKGLAGGLKAVATAAAPLVVLTAAIELVMNAMSEADRTAATATANVGKSLQEQARILRETDSVIDSIIHPDWGANTGDIERVTDSWRAMAEATLSAEDATDAQRAAAQQLLGVIKSGNLGTEEGTAAMEAYSTAMGASTLAAQKAMESQRDLADVVADAGASHDELAGAVADAAEAQAEQNRITSTSKGLMEAYASNTWDAVNATLALFDKQFAARDAQRKYNDQIAGWGKAMEEAGGSADKQGAVLDDLAESALDAAAALAEQDRQTALNNGTFLAAAEVTAKQVEHLKALRDQAVTAGMPQPVIDSLNTYITSLETAQTTAAGGITLDTDISLLTPEQVNTKVQELKNRVRDAAQAGDWGLVTTLQADLDRITADRTVDVTTETEFTPGGYEAVKARKDYLAANVAGTITNSVVFAPDGYNALKARKDYLAADRTAYIDVVLRGAESARRQVDGLGRTGTPAAGPAQQAAAPQQVTNHWSVTVQGATDPRAVVRALERYVRDNGRPESVVVKA